MAVLLMRHVVTTEQIIARCSRVMAVFILAAVCTLIFTFTRH